nr:MULTISPECIES: hypothetical protein [unclassified Nocardiopsis]
MTMPESAAVPRTIASGAAMPTAQGWPITSTARAAKTARRTSGSPDSSQPAAIQPTRARAETVSTVGV